MLLEIRIVATPLGAGSDRRGSGGFLGGGAGDVLSLHLAAGYMDVFTLRIL